MAQLSVLQSICIPGSSNRENDDAYGAAGNYAFVLDGVTSLADPPLLPGRSDAAWVARRAQKYLLSCGSFSPSDLGAELRRVARAIAIDFQIERLRESAERFELPWTTVCLMSCEPGRLHLAYAGDSRILVETHDGSVHNFGVATSRSPYEIEMARKMIAQSGGRELGMETIRETVLPELKRSRSRVNTPGGHWLLGADPEIGSHASVTSLSIDGPATVLMVTDGFYALCDDYEHYNDRGLIATAQTLGVEALAHELRRIEDGDPFGAKFPRMKKSDDATALLLRVEPQ